MVKELNGGHSERSEAESKNPAAVTRGYATGFLDFARNDGHSKASRLQGFNDSMLQRTKQSLVAAMRDRKERARPLLRQSARLVEEHTDHAVRGRLAQSLRLKWLPFSVRARSLQAV